LRQGQTVIKTGQLDANTVVANSDRNFLLSYPNKDQPALNPGQYQLSGELLWGEDIDTLRSKDTEILESKT